MIDNVNELVSIEAKPFLKWAGGKTQLLADIEENLPVELLEGKITRYVEPFVGSGAVLFYLLSKNYIKEEAYIWDVNPELVTVYQVVQNSVNSLIELLHEMENKFLKLEKDERKEFYYEVRDNFNLALENFNFNEYGKHKIERASQFIFLNRTCFNGLFRVNKKGLFNVPMGDYKNPTICNEANLLAVNKLLQKVIIKNGDYKESKELANDNTFFYFDPPYRPLNTSSSFTSYSKYDFKDEQQEELSDYFRELDSLNAKLMLSNSDPTNTNPDDDFFDKLYKGYNIKRVSARRNINSKGSSRGEIRELLITNY